MGLFDFFVDRIAIDLGTANTLIIHKDKVVVNEPSIIAIDRASNKVISVGREAMQMHEKTHERIKTIRPLKDGVIADFHAAEWMIRSMIRIDAERTNAVASTLLCHGDLHSLWNHGGGEKSRAGFRRARGC